MSTLDTHRIESFDSTHSIAVFSVADELYPRDAIYATAYIFIDRAYVLLDRQGDRIVVRLRGKSPLSEADLHAMSGEFANELLAQTLRRRIASENGRIIEAVTALAIGAATGLPVNPLTTSDAGDATEFVEDPLGLGKPWEPEGR